MPVTVAQVAKRYDEFISMAMSFCNDLDVAQELVSFMFLKLCEVEHKEGNLDRLSYKDEINTYYGYRIMLNRYRDDVKAPHRAKAQFTDIVLEPLDEHSIDEYLTIDEFSDLLEHEYDESLESISGAIEDSLDNQHWYDAQLFRTYKNHKSVRQLAEETGISHTSIYNTLRNVREQIKEDCEALYEQHKETRKKFDT